MSQVYAPKCVIPIITPYYICLGGKEQDYYG